MATGRFDDLTDVYEAMIDWPKRLANEEPFFHRLFDQAGARHVADVACGTGRHAAMFHGWGLQVDAADISPQMIAKAREQFGQPGGLTWSVRGFEEPIPAERPLDVVTCLGNSLALANDRATAERALAGMVRAARSGGLVVIHLLNLWRLDDGPVQWQKCLVLDVPQGKSLVVKGVQRVGERGFVHLVVAPLAAPGQFQSESPPLLSFEVEPLRQAALAAGASKVQFYGNHNFQPYDRRASVDLIMVAEK